MTIWEYEVISKSGTPLEASELSVYGKQGWELITIIEDYLTLRGIPEKATRYYIFKRPRTDL
jgi:hypothetical protein